MSYQSELHYTTDRLSGFERLRVDTPQTLLTAGGTHTGGTELDVIRLKAANVTAQSQSVGNSPQDERGVAANTYYFRLLNSSGTDAVLGTFKARFEERPSGFFQT